MEKMYWYPCPKCGHKMLMVVKGTKLIQFPGYCKKCKQTTLINDSEPLSRAIRSID